jgi:hypothetical protein
MVKLPSIHIGKLSLLLSILVWLALLFVDLVRLFGMINDIDSGISDEITWILEILFFFIALQDQPIWIVKVNKTFT